MTPAVAQEPTEVERGSDQLLARDVLAHLETQLESAHRLLGIVLEQGAAIRRRAVPEVVSLAGALQAELHRRELIERERLGLLDRASMKLGVATADVSIRMLAVLMDAEPAAAVRARTVELREVLYKIQREHNTNRALMQQELAFLDHLLRLAGSAGGYGAAGQQAGAQAGNSLLHRPVFDVEA